MTTRILARSKNEALPHLSLIRQGDHYAAVLELMDEGDDPLWLWFDDVDVELSDPPRSSPKRKPVLEHIDAMA